MKIHVQFHTSIHQALAHLEFQLVFQFESGQILLILFYLCLGACELHRSLKHTVGSKLPILANISPNINITANTKHQTCQILYT